MDDEICLYCGKELDIISMASFCSGKCRTKFYNGNYGTFQNEKIKVRN